MKKDPAAIGIYQRGSVYWLAHQRNGQKRSFLSLETTDYAEAIVRAAALRNAPALQTE